MKKPDPNSDPASTASVGREKPLSLILRFMGPYRRRLVGVCLLTVVLSVLGMLPPLLLRFLVDSVLGEGRDDLFTGLAVVIILIPVAAASCRFFQTVGITWLGQRFVFDLRAALYQHLLGLSLRFHGKMSVGKLINRLMGDSGRVQQMLTAQTVAALSDLVCAAFAATAAFSISWRLGLVLLVMILIFLYNYRTNIQEIRQAGRHQRSSMDLLSAGVQNRLTGSLAVKTFGREGVEQGRFNSQSNDSLRLMQQAAFAGNRFSMNSQLIHQLGRTLLYFGGCGLVLTGRLSYGDVIAFVAYSMQLLGPAVRFSEIARQLQDVRVSVERLAELLAETQEVREKPDALRIAQLKGAVSFEHVAFHYDPEIPVIRDFSLNVVPGQSVALIGPTGCGKSTLLSLLLRFYDVTGGSLRVDGHDIRDLRLADYRQNFGVVLQEPMLFETSLLENIRYGCPSASRADVEAAAEAAELRSCLDDLPEGLDTVLGQQGRDLSLGQKQRLTIARAILADPAIMIMDEATSALDTYSEQAIQKAMDKLLAGRTSFVVAHRLSTIRNVDRIVLLDGGRIVESGNHDELMAREDGRYRAMYLAHLSSGSMEVSE